MTVFVNLDRTNDGFHITDHNAEPPVLIKNEGGPPGDSPYRLLFLIRTPTGFASGFDPPPLRLIPIVALGTHVMTVGLLSTITVFPFLH